MRAGVQAIRVEDGRAVGVVLDDGAEIATRQIISSAGAVETHRLLGAPPGVAAPAAGRLSFTEGIAVLDRAPHELGCDNTVVFFNDNPKFHWRRPEEDLCDVRTGVICTPSNYAYEPDDGTPPEPMMRVTALANYDRWMNLSEGDYSAAKTAWYDQMIASAVRFVPDFRHAVVDTDMFTPRTIERFTWHDGGAVYGAPVKRPDGATGVDNVRLCGTDQGFVGIIGAITSGIAIANGFLMEQQHAPRLS
jgi:phytoene dehydrogenase-like protein